MEKIQSDIDRITRDLELEEKCLNNLKEKIKPYTDRLDEMLNGKNSDEKKNLEKLFKEENPEYAEFIEKIEDQESKVNALRTDKIGRAKLFNRLEDCIDRIESHFAA